MEGNLITVALVGSPDRDKYALFHALIQGSVCKNHTPAFPVPRGTYRYLDEEYLLLNLPETESLSSGSPPSALPVASYDNQAFTRQFLLSGRADILLVLCSALCLEQGLKLLSQLLKLPVVKDEAVPAVFCIHFDEKAKADGIQIDFDLLEDVLQIPVLPCYLSSPEYLDDIKTAVSAVWNRLFSYECLDFSPKRLAAETTSRLPPNLLSSKAQSRTTFPSVQFSLGEKINFFCIGFSFLLFLLWLILTGGCIPSLGLWRIVFWLKKRTGIAFIRFVLPALLLSLQR